MRVLAHFTLICAGFLAGCAAPNTGLQQSSTSPGVYAGRVVAVNHEPSGDATTQIVQLLGWQAPVPQTGAEEIVMRLNNGEVKSFVPPPGIVPANLEVGSQVVVTETPILRIVVK